MPVKLRAAKERRPQFSAEAIEFFFELEHMSRRDREHWEDDRRAGRRREYLDKSKRLAALLDLSSEFWGGNNVNDTSSGPCHPPGYPAHDDWFKVRRVRLELLAAVGMPTRRRRSRTIRKLATTNEPRAAEEASGL
jgi:hypothetical protein